MNCTRCSCSGFINLEQLPDEIARQFDTAGDHQVILDWINANEGHDVSVCDCCGDGENWYGTPGQHTKENGKWDSRHTPHCI